MIAQSNQYIAVLDTCVLAPMPLCDTLLRLAEDPAFYIPKYSPDIVLELRSTLHARIFTTGSSPMSCATGSAFPPQPSSSILNGSPQPPRPAPLPDAVWIQPAQSAGARKNPPIRAGVSKSQQLPGWPTVNCNIITWFLRQP